MLYYGSIPSGQFLVHYLHSQYSLHKFGILYFSQFACQRSSMLHVFILCTLNYGEVSLQHMNNECCSCVSKFPLLSSSALVTYELLHCDSITITVILPPPLCDLGMKEFLKTGSPLLFKFCRVKIYAMLMFQEETMSDIYLPVSIYYSLGYTFQQCT